MKTLLKDFDKIVDNLSIEILEHGHFLGDTSWKHRQVTSPFSRLYFIFDGEGFIQSRHKKTVLSPGTAYLIPTDSTFDYICNNYLEKFYIHFRMELFYLTDIFETTDECLSMCFDREALSALIKKAAVTGSLSDIFSLKVFLLNHIAAFVKSVSADTSPGIENALKYKEVLQYIKSNCSFHLTAGEMAERFNISAQTFSRHFKKDMGFTFKSYLDKRILRAAMDKLLMSDMTIREIALSLDFCDEFYFSRFFKKHTGASPKAYRKNFLLNRGGNTHNLR